MVPLSGWPTRRGVTRESSATRSGRPALTIRSMRGSPAASRIGAMDRNAASGPHTNLDGLWADMIISRLSVLHELHRAVLHQADAGDVVLVFFRQRLERRRRRHLQHAREFAG